MASTIRICMLNADYPVPAVFAQRAPTYGRIFHELLAKASPNVNIQSTDFDVRELQYPDSIDQYDAIIISGSGNSSYDDIPWVHQLDAYIREVYQNHPQIKIFGSCFGHQIVCQSLLREHGVKVEKDPNGWEIGVKQISLHQAFQSAFSRPTPQNIRLQFVHHDHVVIPTPNSLPPSWTTFGSTQHCAVQGVYEPGRVFTLQGHFEFDRFVNSETVKTFFSSWAPEALDAALKGIDEDDDAMAAAQMTLAFLLEEQPGPIGGEKLLNVEEPTSLLESEAQIPVPVKS